MVQWIRHLPQAHWNTGSSPWIYLDFFFFSFLLLFYNILHHIIFIILLIFANVRPSFFLYFYLYFTALYKYHHNCGTELFVKMETRMAFKTEHHVSTAMMLELKKVWNCQSQCLIWPLYTMRDFSIQKKIFEPFFTKNVNFKVLQSKPETSFVPSGCMRYDVHINGKKMMLL